MEGGEKVSELELDGQVHRATFTCIKYARRSEHVHCTLEGLPPTMIVY